MKPGFDCQAPAPGDGEQHHVQRERVPALQRLRPVSARQPPALEERPEAGGLHAGLARGVGRIPGRVQAPAPGGLTGVEIQL